MNEDIRKNAINEEDLESVSGGMGKLLNQGLSNMKPCPKCGGPMVMHCKILDGAPTPVGYFCSVCGEKNF